MLPQLAKLAGNDGGFKRFVLKHVDHTLNDDDLKKISTNAAGGCPEGLARLCRDLKSRSKQSERKVQDGRGLRCATRRFRFKLGVKS
jgi:hypothetical protein